MIPMLIAALLAAEPAVEPARRLTFDVTVDGYGGSRESGGAELGAGLRGEHLGGRVFLGFGGAGGEFGGSGGLAATLGAYGSSSRFETEIGVGLHQFTRDEEPDDVDMALVAIGVPATTTEVKGSSAVLPFAQVRIGGAWRVPETRQWFRLGVYARAMDRVRVDYVEETCAYVFWTSSCSQEPRSARYGATTVGIYVGIGSSGTIVDREWPSAPESPGGGN